MRIAFLAPMKAPSHPVPSGDRQMARLLLAALQAAGHEAALVSSFRSFAPAADMPPLVELDAAAADEVRRLSADWHDPSRRPRLIFTYHPYYKAPDLVGPRLAARFGLPTATAEASLSGRHDSGAWAERQARVADAVRHARLNLCFTTRDQAGLVGVAAPDSLVALPPFIDTAGYGSRSLAAPRAALRLVTVAMMRPGDKLRSYQLLGQALARLTHLPWTLEVIGDGAARAPVRDALAGLAPERVRWCGEVASDQIAASLAEADIFVWPGFNEAYGLCYLEAQAAGLPVVAVNNAGTPSVMRDGATGLLTPADVEGFALAVERLMTDRDLRIRMGMAAAAFVRDERSLGTAAALLGAAIAQRFT